MDALLPRLAIPEGPLQPDALFSFKPQGLAFEVGFGGGEHLVAQARARPDWGFFGCEPFINGMAQALAQIDTDGLANIRLSAGDARDVLERLPPASLDAVFVLFPDPWPKKRHWKRRFIGPDTVPLVARALKPGGLLRVASDIPDYVRWTLIHIVPSGLFDWTAKTPADWRLRPADWPGTRYEAKALRAGRSPVYLEFKRSALRLGA
jgi:tRNA (guanine-N7-)-methyltransferase